LTDFTDEASVWKDFTGYKRWVNNEIDDREEIIKHPGKVNIWGCIRTNGNNIIYLFDGNMTKEIYKNILHDIYLPSYNNFHTFQDDNDPKHRSHLVTNWKKENNIISLEWPSCSPDLNPIENVWKLLKKNISQHITVTTSDNQFKKHIIDEWKKINHNTINNIINSMPNRVSQIIKNNGNYIYY